MSEKEIVNNESIDEVVETSQTEVNVNPNDEEENLSEEEVVTEEVQPEPSELDVLKEENAALEDKVLRLNAEISNIQRRHTIDRQNSAKYRSQKLASELLDVIDNLERALMTEVQSDDAKNLKEGVEMVHKQFVSAFEKENITVIDPLNEEFDPNFHQAVSMMPASDGQASNTVINVLQKGYLLEDRVIRPAMVIVAE